MDAKKPGNISKEADGYRVQFERRYPYSSMIVWEAITNPEKLAIWFMKVDMELKPGARMVIHYNDEGDTKGYGKITAVEPGKLFEYIWENEEAPDEYEVSRWEIFAEGASACRLVLTHTRINEKYAPLVPAGWHIMLNHLEEVLSGRMEPFPPGSDSPEDKKIKSFYKELFTA